MTWSKSYEKDVPHCPKCGRQYARVTKHQVINLHREHREWTSVDIANNLGCMSAYVRATARRNNLVLPSRMRKT